MLCNTSITYAVSSPTLSTTHGQTFFLTFRPCRLALATTNMQEPAAIMEPFQNSESSLYTKWNGSLPTAKYLYMQVISSLRSDESTAYRSSQEGRDTNDSNYRTVSISSFRPVSKSDDVFWFLAFRICLLFELRYLEQIRTGITYTLSQSSHQSGECR